MQEHLAETERRSMLPVLAVLFVLFSVGCDSTVDPIVETDRPYTLWGWLDPTADLQKVRLFEIEPILVADDGAPSTATVTLTDLTSGASVAWRDSVVQFASGSYGHVFIADTPVEYDREYRLDAAHPNGQVSTVRVATPPRTAPRVSDIQNVRGNVRVRIDWENAPRLLDLYLIYHVTLTTARNPEPEPFSLVIQSGTILQDTGTGLGVVVEPSLDIGAVYGALNVSPGGLTAIELLGIDVRPFVAAAEWTPPTGRTFNPELLVQPGTLSNVQNGFGFVSAGFEDSFVIQLSDDAARNAGFTVR
ncbi:MAG: hypothetical protein RIE53_03625 [Rhodothermales bacterium]